MTTLERVAELWDQYKAIYLEDKGYYEREIEPMLIEYWRKEAQCPPGLQGIDISVHTLGTSPIATIHSILVMKPRKVYLLCTPKTLEYVKGVQRETGVDILTVEVSTTDIDGIYSTLQKAIEANPKSVIAADITGGTKAMSAGLGAAAYYLGEALGKAGNLRVVYVTSEHDEEVRKPRAGSEVLEVLRNPFEVRAEFDYQRGLDHYQQGNYASAAESFSLAQQKTGELYYQILGQLAGSYERWASLDFAKAATNLKKLVTNLKKYKKLSTSPLYQQLDHLQDQLVGAEAAARVFQSSTNGRLQLHHAADREGVLWLLATLKWLADMHNKRDVENTVLRAVYLYRALELAAQHLLLLEGIDTNEPQLTAEMVAGRRAILEDMFERTGKKEAVKELPDKLSLFDNLVILAHLGKLGKVANADLKGIFGVIQSRNASILIHGMTVPSTGDIESLNKYVKLVMASVGNLPRVEPLTRSQLLKTGNN